MLLTPLVRALAATVLVAAPLAVPGASPAAPATTVADAVPDPARTSSLPVWVAPVSPHAENPTNPLAGRLWGVYEGPQDQVWRPVTQATGRKREALAVIAERPRTK